MISDPDLSEAVGEIQATPPNRSHERLGEADLSLFLGPWWLVPTILGDRRKEKNPAGRWQHLKTQEEPTHESLPIAPDGSQLIRPHMIVLRHHCVFDFDIQRERRGQVNPVEIIEAIIQHFPRLVGNEVGQHELPAFVVTPSGGIHIWWKASPNADFRSEVGNSNRKIKILTLEQLPERLRDAGVNHVDFLPDGLVMAPGSVISAGRYRLLAGTLVRGQFNLPSVMSLRQACEMLGAPVPHSGRRRQPVAPRMFTPTGSVTVEAIEAAIGPISDHFGNRGCVAMGLPVALTRAGHSIDTVENVVEQYLEQAPEPDGHILRNFHETCSRIRQGQRVAAYHWLGHVNYIAIMQMFSESQVVEPTEEQQHGTLIRNRDADAVWHELYQSDQLLYIWHPQYDQFFRWNGTHYEIIDEEEPKQLFIRQCAEMEIPVSTTAKNEFINYLRSFARVDPSKINPVGYWNLENGVLSFDEDGCVIMDPHDAYNSPFFTYALPVVYDERLLELETPYYDQCRALNPNVIDALEKYFCGIIRGNTNERFLILVGPRATGKSTDINFFREMFGPEACSEIDPILFGQPFGRGDLLLSQCNIHDEITGGRKLWTNEVLSTLKALATGTTVDINRKNKQPIKITRVIPQIYGGNQLVDLPTSDNWDALFRRTWIEEAMGQISRPSLGFKQGLMEERSIVFTKLIFDSPEMEICTFDEWAAEGKRMWTRWANVIARALSDCYEPNEEGDELAADVRGVIEWFLEEKRIGFTDDLYNKKITMALEGMGGRRREVRSGPRGHRKRVVHYEGISLRTEYRGRFPRNFVNEEGEDEETESTQQTRIPRNHRDDDDDD